MKYAIIAGDIVSSTSLQQEDKIYLEQSLKALLKELNTRFSVYGRLIKGDYIECGITNVAEALKIALLIKAYVKTIHISLKQYTTQKKRAKLFNEHGIRLALAVGTMDRVDVENEVLDGEAIYMAGRKINSSSTHNKDRIVIKKTLFFISKNEDETQRWDSVLGLLDVLMAKATARQSEVLYLKLLGHEENEIANKLGIDQSVVNRHSTSIGWNAIEAVITNFYNSYKQ